jgi:DNA-binding NarL/FixJ family response regulator
MTIKLLLVDDHPVFRRGLQSLLESEPDFEIVGQGTNGIEAVEQVRELHPDVVIMDITMPEMDGISATRTITSEFPGTRIIALSIHGGKRFVENMLQAGAAGYILKDSVPEELVEGIRDVVEGKTYLSAEVTSLVISQYVDLLTQVQKSSATEKLGPPQHKLLGLLAEGETEARIAEIMELPLEAVTQMEVKLQQQLGLTNLSDLKGFAGINRWFLGKDSIEETLRNIMAPGSSPGRRTPGQASLIEPLTNRELDTLALLAQRLYNKEIADQLSVSIETVKTHTKHIYQKLGVNNRREAIAKAVDMGLVPNS